MSKTKDTLRLGAARILGIAVQLVSVPIVWDILGGEQFGICLFLIVVGRWVSLVDIGYGVGAQQLMTRALEAGDRAKAYTVFRTYLLLMLAHAAVGFGVFVALGRVPALTEQAGTALSGSVFVAAAALFVAQYLFAGTTFYYNASRQFSFLALVNGFQFLLSAVAALGLTLWLRTPEAYLAGFAVGYGTFFLVSLARVLSQSKGANGARWFDKEAFLYCFGFARRLYLTKVSSVTVGTLDRIAVMNVLGPAGLTPYSTAARIPDAATEALPLSQTLLPDFTKAHMEGGRRFAKLVEKSTRVALMAGCGLIFIPCAFGGPALQLWLSDKYVPEMAAVILLIGFLRAIETYFGGLGQAMLAHGVPHRLTWLTLITAALVLAFTFPVVRAWGIVGVAALRGVIYLVEFVPVTWYVWRTVVPEIAFLPWVGRLGGTLGVAGLFAVMGYLISGTPMVTERPWLALIAAPIAVAAFFYLVDLTRLAPVPDSVKKRVRKLFGGPGSWA
ncbi:MAG: hypothetical protein IH945_00095 [Armatimonadetes bacterium]|nr:hypothetical protein [Armatimonadota bacterium]